MTKIVARLNIFIVVSLLSYGCSVINQIEKNRNKPHRKVENKKYANLRSMPNPYVSITDKKKGRDNSYKRGVNYEYYKNGNVKSISKYRRKIYRWYTYTFWEIYEYDIKGNLVRIVKKVIQTARKNNVEKILEERIINMNPSKTPENNNQ
ncbi:MAG: hypothetical protein NZ529_01675 [Cytophagaceae bacterium]|nr:hypothetical protein [Cytophagaceae bacterium]MDW8455476.1 hypothetical protein [Cytophagaceae bacterium]